MTPGLLINLMMQIQVSRISGTNLIHQEHQSQPFMVLGLQRSYFLLIKANEKVAVDKHIVFEMEGREYYSTFARHINLSYAGKLSDVVDSIQIATKPGLQHNWLIFYEIHDFLAHQSVTYNIEVPVYGMEVLVHFKNGALCTSIISNMFRHNGQTFYFLNLPPSDLQEFSIITDKSQRILYGLTYFIKSVTICLPFNSICSEKQCPINIAPWVQPLLLRTCYIWQGSSYCTGFILGDRRVISTRHLLFLEDQKLGVEVGVRFYPYTEEKIGYVSRIGSGNIDIIEIEIASTKLDPQFLHAPDNFKTEDLLGKQILAVGFGKFAYSPKIFHRIDIVMPCIEPGIVSKVINLSNRCVFIKTDAFLYNGFSGCGIWWRQQLIGMAVFILKSKNNKSMFNRHNFSYSTEFINHLLSIASTLNSKQENSRYLVSPASEQLAKFDKIQMRFYLPLPKF